MENYPLIKLIINILLNNSTRFFESYIKDFKLNLNNFLNYPHGRTKEDIDGDIEINNKRRDLALYAEKEFQTMQCLNSLVEAFFTYFQECVGPDVEEFWRRIKEANLPYERENKLEKIMKRGRIRNDIEYDYVVDTIVPFQQEGIISEDDVKKLNDMIEKFENKRRRL